MSTLIAVHSLEAGDKVFLPCFGCTITGEYNRDCLVDSYSSQPLKADGGILQVKLWCTNQEASVFSIDMKANICCVKYNPGSSNHIAVSFGLFNISVDHLGKPRYFYILYICTLFSCFFA